MGEIKALQLQAALGMGLRAGRSTLPPKYKIQYPSDAYKYIKDEMENEKQEQFAVILLDTKGCVITREIVSIGTLSQTLLHPREVFYPAIRHKAASMVLAHNHPSGDPSPSEDDRITTEQLVAMVNVNFLSLIIITHREGPFRLLKKRRNRFQWVIQ